MINNVNKCPLVKRRNSSSFLELVPENLGTNLEYQGDICWRVYQVHVTNKRGSGCWKTSANHQKLCDYLLCFVTRTDVRVLSYFTCQILFSFSNCCVEFFFLKKHWYFLSILLRENGCAMALCCLAKSHWKALYVPGNENVLVRGWSLPKLGEGDSVNWEDSDLSVILSCGTRERERVH